MRAMRAALIDRNYDNVKRRTVTPTIQSTCENDGLQYVQEAAYSPFCIAGAQASRHSKGATKGETEVLESRSAQVSEALSRNGFDRKKSRLGKTIEGDGGDQADRRRPNEA